MTSNTESDARTNRSSSFLLYTGFMLWMMSAPVMGAYAARHNMPPNEALLYVVGFGCVVLAITWIARRIEERRMMQDGA